MKKVKTGTKAALYVIHFVLIMFVFLPLIFAFSSSFRPMAEIYKYISPLSIKTFIPQEFTLEAYKEIFINGGYGRALLNSLFVAFSTVVLGVVFNGMAGYAFAKYEFPCKNILFVLVLLSYMVPFELLSINLYSMMIDIGWMDSYLALIIPCVPNGMIIFLFRQFYMSFPDNLIEAARIDGMGDVGIFFKIVMPNSKAVCISAALVQFVLQWESFLWPVLVTRSKDMYTIQIALSNFSTQYTKYWNQIFAGSLIAFLLPVSIILPLQKFYAAGLTTSGIKE